jgi:hypothetical protein
LLPKPKPSNKEDTDDDESEEEIDKQVIVSNFAANSLVYEKKFDYF